MKKGTKFHTLLHTPDPAPGELEISVFLLTTSFLEATCRKKHFTDRLIAGGEEGSAPSAPTVSKFENFDPFFFLNGI